MSKADILGELPKLTPDDRGDILAQLWSLEARDALQRGPAAEEKTLLDVELTDYEAKPVIGLPWVEVHARLRFRA